MPRGLVRVPAGSCGNEDVGVLIDCGLVARTEDGKIHVPYDVIRAEFDLSAVA
jgi:hypothetical protein